MTELKNLSKEEYNQLKDSGMMWEFHPEATGEYEKDVEIPRKKEMEDILAHYEEIHRIWKKFSGWLVKTYGKDLHGGWIKHKIKVDGKQKILKHRSFNDLELNRRLCGYDVMERIEKYIKRCCHEIKIVYCDDVMYATSMILLIPHPKHGITIMFIPQLTEIQNQCFLYGNHYKKLLSALEEMKYVYDKDSLL